MNTFSSFHREEVANPACVPAREQSTILQGHKQLLGRQPIPLHHTLPSNSHPPCLWEAFHTDHRGTAKLQVQFRKPWPAGRTGASPAAQPRRQNATGTLLGGSPHSSQSPALKHTSSCTNNLWPTAKVALQASDGTAKAECVMEQPFSSKNNLKGKEGSKIQVKYSMGIIKTAQTVPLLMCLTLDNWVSFWHSQIFQGKKPNNCLDPTRRKKPEERPRPEHNNAATLSMLHSVS